MIPLGRSMSGKMGGSGQVWSSVKTGSSSSSSWTMDSDSFNDKRPKNDVFLNYLFEDTGRSFVSHLKGGLKNKAFSICDHTMLPKGQYVSSELLRAIEDSEMYLVVFSINYAFSVESLDELVLIMGSLHNFKKRKVFPIFFNVDPSHVRSQQEGSFMEAFKKHQSYILDPERVQKWRQALKDAGQLSGLTLQNGVDEAEFVLKIIKELEKMQSPQELHVTDHHVGIKSRAEELISKLRLDCKDRALVIAVFGISGIGKTTIVKAVYNTISAEFDVSCFLANIHDHCCVSNWKDELPRLLISCLTQNDKFSIMHHHNDYVTKIKKFIRGRKILLVLDDVDSFQQLEALGINPKWFNHGSRIIVTTRDKHSLGVIPYTSYNTKLLNERESLNLFTQLMFARDDPKNSMFIEEVVSRAGGLPLVLKVWSRHFKQYENKQWPSILETLKRIPHGDVQKQLQMSYDSLPDRSKKLFLDIAYFFNGWKKDLVVKVLQDEDSAFFPDHEIQYLVDKSLVKIDYEDPGRRSRVSMHHAIREMGQEVVRQENEDEPGKRSRLMDHRDVISILRDCSGTESVESIQLDNIYMEESVTVKVEAIKKMSNLRFIQLIDRYQKLSWSSSSSKDRMSSFTFKKLSNENESYISLKKLKYLEWDYFPLKCIDIDMENVVVIKLQNSNLKKLWKRFKSLKKLRILDVSSSRSLTKTGDFTVLEKLEELRFRYCEKLEELDSSINCLGKLVVLDLYKCTKLKSFPWEKIGKLRSLEELVLGYCPHLGLKRVKVIDPFLSSLKECCITLLDLSYCKISKISPELGNLKSIKYLNLTRNRFTSLPDSLCQLHELKEIDLSDCTNLKSIPNLPPNIVIVYAENCINLVNLSSNMSELQFLRRLDLNGCLKLEHEGFMKVTGLRNLQHSGMRNCNVSQVSNEIGNLVSLETLNLSENAFSSLPDSFSNLAKLKRLSINDCSELELFPLVPSKLKHIEANGCGSLNNFPCKRIQDSFFSQQLRIGLSMKEVPNWCSYTSNGDELSFVAPSMQHLDNKIFGVIVYAILSDFKSNYPLWFLPTMVNKTKDTRHRFSYRLIERCSMYVMFCPINDITLVVEPGDTILLPFDNQKDVKVVSCGLRLIYEFETVPCM